MLNPLNILSKFIKSGNQRELDKLQSIVNEVNKLEENISKLNEWKDILTLVPLKFKKTSVLKKSSISGLFSASLELTREGFISISQKRSFDKLFIKERK